MRNYLSDFFTYQQYNDDDARFLLDAYDKITKNDEARKLWEQAIEMYNKDRNCQFDVIISIADQVASLTGIHEYTAELLIHICLSRHLRELYEENGIDIEIYDKSMADLKYKLEECKLVYGIVGTFVAEWFARFFKLTRFALGRLQFEIVPLRYNYNKNGITLTPESNVINVHIPRSGEPLTEEACMEAYARAKQFFKDEISTEPCPFVCHSWLLYPEMENIVPKHTNTYKFFKSFELYDHDTDKSRGDLWRLFDSKEQNVDRLPADTSLRRAFIAHLKQGGKLGSGRGILFI